MISCAAIYFALQAFAELFLSDVVMPEVWQEGI